MPMSTTTARSPKGERTRHAILDAATEQITLEGLASASQDAVAKRAGISQSALRHHFPTKDDLIAALFERGLERHRSDVTTRLLEPGVSARDRLMTMAAEHLTYVSRASDTFTFETWAYATRVDERRTERDDWYVWLTGHYTDLIGQIHPELDETERAHRAFTIVTLLLGAWTTAGRSHPDLGMGDLAAIHTVVLEGIQRIVDHPA